MARGGRGPGAALAAAVLFGLSAPAAKRLVGAVDPWLLAGLLYLGSAVGLGLWLTSRGVLRSSPGEAGLTARDAPRLALAIAAGGVAGPVLLMLGLASGPASQASLLLNLETVFTVLLARLAFREHLGGRMLAALGCIVAGAAWLAWQPDAALALDRSAVLVAAACLAWAIDNNIVRTVAAGDPVQIAMLKGAVAGAVNTTLALLVGVAWPPPAVVLAAGVVGFVGYGASLVLFLLALRHLGAARTAGYFAVAPFVGAVASVLALHEPATFTLLVTGVLMAAGVGLSLAERHEHEHVHEALGHEHVHRHDEHHQHEHEPGVPAEPHTHWHVHAALRHRHPHYPDLHHRHGH